VKVKAANVISFKPWLIVYESSAIVGAVPRVAEQGTIVTVKSLVRVFEYVARLTVNLI